MKEDTENEYKKENMRVFVCNEEIAGYSEKSKLTVENKERIVIKKEKIKLEINGEFNKKEIRNLIQLCEEIERQLD